MELGILFAVGTTKFYIVWWCILIGSLDFLYMFVKSIGPYRYSKYRTERLKDQEESLRKYNIGIYPSLGCDETEWSY